MKRIALSICIIFIGILGYAQNYTISGYLRDGNTGEELLYSSVSVEGQAVGVTTNLYGFYSLTLPKGNYTLLFSYLGYLTKKQEIVLDKNLEISVELSSSSNELDEIVVTGKVENENVTNTEVSVVTLDVKEIKKIPVFMGEQNIMSTIQLMPGVSSSSEGSSGFFVRGGNSDENLILLDEAPVYNASHLLGFFSVFNSDALKDVKLYKGGIPAQYGGRASSVMDIRMKNGNIKEWHGSGGVGLISSRLTLEGPIKKDQGSVIMSARRTYADVVAKVVSDKFDGLDLYFYDLNLKANYILGSKDRLYISGYLGRDIFGLDAFGFDWGNKTLTTRWNHQFNSKLFSNTSFIYSDYNYGFGLTAGNLKIDLNAGIFDTILSKITTTILTQTTKSLLDGKGSITNLDQLFLPSMKKKSIVKI